MMDIRGIIVHQQQRGFDMQSGMEYPKVRLYKIYQILMDQMSDFRIGANVELHMVNRVVEILVAKVLCTCYPLWCFIATV